MITKQTSLYTALIVLSTCSSVSLSASAPSATNTTRPSGPEAITKLLSEPQCTLALIKPDGVASGYTGDIIKTIERNGLKIQHIKKFTLSPKLAHQFYAEHASKPFFKSLMAYITSGPIIAMVLEGNDAVKTWRALMGTTNPKDASPGTIRRMFARDKTYNAVHGSATPSEAATEIALIFGH